MRHFPPAWWRGPGLGRDPELPVGWGVYLFTACSLWWENIAGRIWPYGLAVFLFLTLAWFDGFAYWPGWLHALFLVGLGWGGLFAVRDLWRHGSWPKPMAIYHRIELNSELHNRPLTGLQDSLPDGAGVLQRQWWQWHLAQLRERLGPLRWGWPRFGFAPNDPFAVRSLVLLLFCLGLLQAGRDWDARLWRALLPNVPPASSLIQEWQVYAKPPAYTGLPQQDLKPLAGEVAAIPAGAEIFVQLHGVKTRAAVTVDAIAQPIEAMGDGSFQSHFILPAAERLQLQLGWQTLAGWRLQVIPDTAPSIEWQGEVYATPRAAIRLGYAAVDDYGLAKVMAEIKKPDESDTITVILPNFPTLKGKVQNSSYHDLAWHRWAGEKVQIRLLAQDALNQPAASPWVDAQLPERSFKHPVAMEIAALRRDFMFARIDRAQLSQKLLPILSAPQAFDYDGVFTLGARVAQVRAALVPDSRDDDSILGLLWDLALRLDDQGISLAERDLRGLEQALQEAIARGASGAEIEMLLDQYTAAMNQYLQTMAQQMQQDGMSDLSPMDPSAQSLEVGDLDRLLAQIRQLLQSGQTAEAQQLLSKLQEMMANLRQQQGQPSPEQKAVQALIKTAQELIRRQQQALDHSAALAAGAKATTTPKPEDQGKIRSDAQSFVKELQKYLPPPAPFDAALTAMRQAQTMQQKNAKTEAAQSQNLQNVLQAQTAALESLRAGLHELLQNAQNGGGGGMVRAGSGAYDPFGRTRPGQGPLDDPNVKVPGVPELQRSQEILQELQNRSGDFSRPEIERDYIKRLLRRF